LRKPLLGAWDWEIRTRKRSLIDRQSSVNSYQSTVNSEEVASSQLPVGTTQSPPDGHWTLVNSQQSVPGTTQPFQPLMTEN